VDDTYLSDIILVRIWDSDRLPAVAIYKDGKCVTVWHQENNISLEWLEQASLAILAEHSSPARELGLTRHSLFARGKIH
jgi:hypothetical protein